MADGVTSVWNIPVQRRLMFEDNKKQVSKKRSSFKTGAKFLSNKGQPRRNKATGIFKLNKANAKHTEEDSPDSKAVQRRKTKIKTKKKRKRINVRHAREGLKREECYRVVKDYSKMTRSDIIKRICSPEGRRDVAVLSKMAKSAIDNNVDMGGKNKMFSEFIALSKASANQKKTVLLNNLKIIDALVGKTMRS